MPLRMGRKPDDYSRPKLDLTNLAASADFSMVPATQENVTPDLHAKLKMLGNGPGPDMGPDFPGAGDCEPVRWANHRLLMTGDYPADVQTKVWDLYKTQNPNFDPHGDPNTNGPGSGADQGMSSDELLSYLHNHGDPDGVKVVAYGTIDPHNVAAVERAIALFGGVWLDILVQPGNQQEFSNNQPWTDTGEAPEGGHAVLSAGFTPERRILTWMDETTLADSFWNGSTSEGPLIERVYLVIWPEHATREFIASQGAAALAADYQALTGKTLQWPSAPTPAPTPASGGASFLVNDPAVVAHISKAAQRKNLSVNDWVTLHLQRYFKLAELVTED